MILAALLLLAGPGEIRVGVEGGEGPVEVLAFAGGVVRARARGEGTILLSGLPPGAYSLLARGSGRASAVEHEVRTVGDGGPGLDALLRLEPAAAVEARSSEGASLFWSGLPFPPGDLLLPLGFATLLADDPERVSGAQRLLRVQGPMRADLPLDTGMVVTGRVFGPSGDPLEGARVEVFVDGAPAGREAHTDRAGEFGIMGFRGDAVSIRVTALRSAEALRRVLYFPGEERARVELRLDPASEIRIPSRPDETFLLLPRWYEEALETRGRLAAQYQPRRRSGGASARFGHLVPGAEYRVVASAEGRLARATAPFVAPPPGRTLALPRLELPPAASVSGRVLGAIPSPFGLFVALLSAGPPRYCRTDRQGRYRFEGLEAGSYALHVRRVDETPRPLELAEGAAATLDLECEPPGPGRAVAGTVLDADGRPLPGVEVEALGRRATTDGEGGFLLDRIPRGPAEVTLSLRPSVGSRAFLEDPHLPRLEPKVRVGGGAKVRLERAGTLRISLDAGSARLARGTLVVSGTSGVTLRRRLPRGARQLLIEEVPQGSYSVGLEEAGLLGTSGAVVRTGEPGVVPVAAGRSASGRVVLRRSVERGGDEPRLVVDEPLRGAVVSLLDFSRPEAYCPADEEGRFELRGLPLATVLLCAAAPGRPPSLLRVDLAPGDATDLALAIYEGVEAGVLVEDEEGKPLEGAIVRLFHEEGPALEDLFERGRFLGALGDDADVPDLLRGWLARPRGGGFYVAPFVAPGSYRVEVSARGHSTVRAGVRAIDPLTAKLLEEAVPHSLRERSPRVRLPRR